MIYNLLHCAIAASYVLIYRKTPLRKAIFVPRRHIMHPAVLILFAETVYMYIRVHTSALSQFIN